MKLFSAKPATKAYTTSMLPQNRREVFWDILRLHWGKFFWMGVMIFLFSLPIHLLTILTDLYAVGGDSADTQEFQQAVTPLYNLRLLLNIPLLALLAIPISGMLRIMRQYAWGENVFFFYDLSKGIRQNWSQCLCVAFIGGSCFALSGICLRSAAGADGLLPYMACIPLGLFLLLIFPLCCYALCAIAVYSNRLLGNFRLALRVYAATTIPTLLTLGGIMLIFLTSYVPNLYFRIAGCVLGSLISPVIMLAWTLFTYAQFDQYVNPQAHPELINRGILGLQYQEQENPDTPSTSESN